MKSQSALCLGKPHDPPNQSSLCLEKPHGPPPTSSPYAWETPQPTQSVCLTLGKPHGPPTISLLSPCSQHDGPADPGPVSPPAQSAWAVAVGLIWPSGLRRLSAPTAGQIDPHGP